VIGPGMVVQSDLQRPCRLLEGGVTDGGGQ
jgi:hypothetical protein